MVAIAIGREFNPRRRLILFLYFAFFSFTERRNRNRIYKHMVKSKMGVNI